MDEQKDDEQRERRPSEGVRIIGAEEAQAAIEAGQAAGRRPDDAPRYGDVPPPPEGPRPAIRFPLGGSTDPTEVARPSLSTPPPPATWSTSDETPPETEPEPPAEVEIPGPTAPLTPSPGVTPAGARTELPHWTEPPTGENPRISVDKDAEDDDLDAWQAVANAGPRWRGEHESDWEDVDTHDPAAWADEESRVGALDPDRPDPTEMYTFEEPRPTYEPYDEEPIYATGTTQAPLADDDEFAIPLEPAPRQIRTSTRPAAQAEGDNGLRAGPGRDVPTAIAVGVGAAVVILGALAVFENLGGVVVVIAVLTMAAMELFNALRMKGFKPATLLGVAGTAAIVWGAYARGEQAVVLVTALFVVFTLLWYLTGVVATNQPTANAGASLMAFCYIGVLGSTAGLLLKWPPDHADGMGIFLGAVLATVAYDVGGFFVGSRAGRTPLAPTISPNKTWEGLIGGMAAAFFVSVIVVTRIHPWDLGSAFALGLVAAAAAPLGDLCESMIKRDLGVKDMSSILPEHGGVLDRIDAMLFVIPATYYLAKFLDLT